MTDAIRTRLREIDLWIAKNENKSDFRDYDEYMAFSLEIGNWTRFLTSVAASMTTDEYIDGMPREVAVLNGLMTRIYKLYDSLCMNIAENRGEIASIFTRMIYESYVNMLYLIANGAGSLESFIKTSYKSSIENYKDLKAKSEQRELIPIELRIKGKIERRVASDELSLEELLSMRSWKFDGKSFRQISSEVLHDSAYHYIFGNQSSLIHGTWQDLKLNHLRLENGRYHPKIEYDNVDPRYINPMTILCLKALDKYLQWSQFDPDNLVKDIGRNLRLLTKRFESLHESREFENL